MDPKIWLLRIVADWSLVLIAWWFILNTLGWGAALFLAAYFVLIVVTEFNLSKMLKKEEEDEEEEEVRNFYPLDNGKYLYATPAEYAMYLVMKRQEELIKEEECQDDQQDQK